jgi:hypothetical protein
LPAYFEDKLAVCQLRLKGEIDELKAKLCKQLDRFSDLVIKRAGKYDFEMLVTFKQQADLLSSVTSDFLTHESKKRASVASQKYSDAIE